MTDDSRIVTLADIQAAFEQYSEGKATPERIWNALPVPSPSGEAAHKGWRDMTPDEWDRAASIARSGPTAEAPSRDVDAARDALLGLLEPVVGHRVDVPIVDAFEVAIRIEAAMGCEAAIRAQSSGLDVLGDYLTGLEYTLSRMPATGSRYTIAADSRLREAFRLVAAEYTRLTEADR